MGFWSNVLDDVKAAFRGNNNTSQSIPDPNFYGSMQMWQPGQPIWTDKDYASFVRNGYRKNPTVYTCINKITSAASGINWKLYKDRDMKKTIDSHALLDLWRKPNPAMPGTGSFIEQNFGFWHMNGNDYIWAYRLTDKTPPVALWPLRPDRMKAVADNHGIQGYVYGYESSDPQSYDTSEILHIKFPGYDNDVYGLSPVEVASYHSDQQNEAMGWNTSLMQNAGRPASVFMSKSYLTVEQRNQVEQEIRKKYSGKRNAGRPLILEADFTWQNMSLTPLELDFLKSYELGTRAICAIFDVAPELAGDSSGKTFANVAEARQALYLENVLPKLDRFSDYLNSWLVPMYPDLLSSGAYFTYDRKDIEALQALYAAQAKAIHDQARADWLAGGILLEEFCELIGAAKPKYGKVRRFGAVLVSEESLEDYADQSLAEPAAPPSALPEPLNIPGLPSPTQPALPPGKQPQLPAPKPNTTAPNTPKPPKNAKQPTQPVKAFFDALEGKVLDTNGIYQPDDVDERLASYYADGVTHLRWVCDGAPCPECLMNDGVIVSTGDAFPSGVKLTPQHPNCFPAGVVVSGPRAIASTERWYEGNLIDIRTASGKFVSVTPNHPILTQYGWVEAGLLKKGDKIISRTSSKGPLTSINPDDYQIPALIEDVARSVGSSLHMMPTSVPVSTMDFHGDGTEGQVCIIRADGLLGNSLNTTFSKPYLQKLFTSRDTSLSFFPSFSALTSFLKSARHTAYRIMSGASTCASLLRSEAGLHNLVGLCQCPSYDTVNSQSGFNGTTRNIKGFSQGLFSFPGLISLTNFLIRQAKSSTTAFSHMLNTQPFSIGIGAQQSTLFKNSSQSRRRKTMMLSRELYAMAGEIIADSVIECNVRAFSGHVYNLETKLGWYIANDIITHNCKCQAIGYSVPGMGFARTNRTQEQKMSQADMLNLLAYKVAQYMAQQKQIKVEHSHTDIADPFECYYDGMYFVTCPLEGYKVHEENTEQTVGTMEEDGKILRLRVMSMEENSLHDTHNKVGVEADGSRLEQTRQLVTSGDAYRAFIARYG